MCKEVNRIFDHRKKIPLITKQLKEQIVTKKMIVFITTHVYTQMIAQKRYF